MPKPSPQIYLLASNDPVLLRAAEPALQTPGVRVEVVLSAEAALQGMNSTPGVAIALLDVRLPGMELGQLLAATTTLLPIVLLSDTVTEESRDWLAEGVVQDVVPRLIDAAFLRLRTEIVLNTERNRRELQILREMSSVRAQTDTLTGVFNRTAMLESLFRETDRAQRMNTALSLLLFDIDDFGHWNQRMGFEACDELLVEVTRRFTRLMRSYDVLGRVGKDEFLVTLPGCSLVHAVSLAERMSQEVFADPFEVMGTAICLTACCGVAPSHGRSPVVVLREAEESLLFARNAGPETIYCAMDSAAASAQPAAFLLNASDGSAGW